MLEDFPFGFVIFAAIGGAAVIGSYYRRTKARAIRDRWVEAADHLGFTLSGGTRNLFMSGSEGQLAASVAVKTDDNETRTRYQVEFPPLGLGLRLTPQAGWQSFVRALGGQDVEIGDATFDDRFVVKASNTDLARQYFNSQRVAALNALYDRYGGFVVNNEELVLMVKGMADEVDTIVSTMNDVMRTARVLQPDAGHAETIVPAADPQAAAREQELQRVFETMEEYAEEGEGLPEPEASTAAHDHAEPATPVTADADALLVATRLFGESRLGFEIEQLFEEEFRGRSIDWTGTVKRPAGLMASREFDEDREAVVIEVASLTDELYGTTSIDAIVAFPGESAPQRGEVVRFTGRLVNVDGVSKDLYVEDGTLS